MPHIKTQAGYTLMELMIAVGIIGVLSAIAIPTYNNYINTSCLSTARTNLEALASFEENYNIENSNYLAGTHTAGSTSSTLMTGLHWDPNDKGEFTYTVTLDAAAGGGGLTYDYVIKVDGTGSCKSATDTYGSTEQGFHQQ